MANLIVDLALWVCDVACLWARLLAFALSMTPLDSWGPKVVEKVGNLRDDVRSKLCAVGKVVLVGAGPGSPDLITVKGLRALQTATCVVYDRLVDPVHMKQLSWRVKLINVGKAPQKKRFPQSAINNILVQEARRGHRVARLKGGDPFVYGLGGDEATVLREHGIPFEIVPGISSAIAVPAYAGIPVTQKGVATSFCVVSGHLPPGAEGAADWDHIPAAKSSTLVILMGTAKLPLIVQHILDKGLRPPSCAAAVIQSGSTASQLVVRSTLEHLVRDAEGMGSPSVVVIGEVVRYGAKLAWFRDGTDRTGPLGAGTAGTAGSANSSVWGSAVDPSEAEGMVRRRRE